MFFVVDVVQFVFDVLMICCCDVVIFGNWLDGMLLLLVWFYVSCGVGILELVQLKLGNLYVFELLIGIDDVVGLLIEVIVNDKCILVVGDFDCDGVIVCVVGVCGLCMFGV